LAKDGIELLLHFEQQADLLLHRQLCVMSGGALQEPTLELLTRSKGGE